MEMIQLKNICKTYSEKNAARTEVLKDVSLTVAKGDYIAVKGPSGAGKSTLLHILGCIDSPSGGEYYLDGKNVAKFSQKQLARVRNEKIGFVLQSFGLILEETALENVKIPLYFSRTPFGEIAARAEYSLESFGIGYLKDRKVMCLSGGEKQRVAIARALLNHPEIILADEPTGALDSKNAEIFMDILTKLNAEGKTVIVVTHEDYVAERCKKVVYIKDGCLGG